MSLADNESANRHEQKRFGICSSFSSIYFVA